MRFLENHIEDIQKLCSAHKVKELYVFGSVLTNSFNAQSDIDFLVNFDAISLDEYADNYFSLKYALETALNHSIDLLEEKAVKNPYFRDSIAQKKKLIYGH